MPDGETFFDLRIYPGSSIPVVMKAAIAMRNFKSIDVHIHGGEWISSCRVKINVRRRVSEDATKHVICVFCKKLMGSIEDESQLAFSRLCICTCLCKDDSHMLLKHLSRSKLSLDKVR